MKILGIDPGMAIVGYGMIEITQGKITLLTSGSIQTDKKLDDSKRLLESYGIEKKIYALSNGINLKKYSDLLGNINVVIFSIVF